MDKGNYKKKMIEMKKKLLLERKRSFNNCFCLTLWKVMYWIYIGARESG